MKGKDESISYSKKRSRESRAAIERIYIAMRHLLIRGSYKPNGLSGALLREALLSLQPEIYGSLGDPEKVELDGLLYVAERLPEGIESCRYIHLSAREGLLESGYQPLIPSKRRRNCFRIDEDRMYVEMSRGRSDIYDILTHLTFLYLEAEKIKQRAIEGRSSRPQDNWLRLAEFVQCEEEGEELDHKVGLVYLSNALGRTVEETKRAVEKFKLASGVSSLYKFTYALGQVAIEETSIPKPREIHFSAKLRDVLGHHIYGESWANSIKATLAEAGLLKRDLHIISANLHSFKNLLYAFHLPESAECQDVFDLAKVLRSNRELSEAVEEYGLEHGLIELDDQSGTMLGVQIVDLEKLTIHPKLQIDSKGQKPVLLIMDYAFGEQAYECMDELLKPYLYEGKQHKLRVKSISIMGKAGSLQGDKGDILLPTAHIFEGTGDNYPFENGFSEADFEGSGMDVYTGSLITVLGTSLQNRDVLAHFKGSTWKAVGLEMEGAHYQKAIQSASKIRKSISAEVQVNYAYYVSDNPLVTGSTLSSGSLGEEGVKPTYWISRSILKKCLES